MGEIKNSNGGVGGGGIRREYIHPFILVLSQQTPHPWSIGGGSHQATLWLLCKNTNCCLSITLEQQSICGSCSNAVLPNILYAKTWNIPQPTLTVATVNCTYLCVVPLKSRAEKVYDVRWYSGGDCRVNFTVQWNRVILFLVCLHSQIKGKERPATFWKGWFRSEATNYNTSSLSRD